MAATYDKLDLSDCELCEVPAGVWDLTNLQELSLASNKLTRLPDDVGRLTSLQRLVVAGNALPALPDALAGLPDLQGLYINSNRLQSLPADLAGLTALCTLHAASNGLETVPESLTQLCSLEDLSLAGNRLRCVPRDWAGLKALQKVQLYGNGLTALPSGLGSLPLLQVLHVMGNELACLPEDLMRSTSLHELNAADNQLADVPGDWSAMQALASLVLYGNALRDVPANIASLPSMAALWIEGNPLTAACLERLLAAAAGSAQLRRLGVTHAQLADMRQQPPEVHTQDTNGASRSPKPSRAAAPSSQGGGRVAPDLQLPVLEHSGPSCLQTSRQVPGCGSGYFKVVPGYGSSAAGAPGHSVTFEDGSTGTRALIVAFGSAPGEPNWAGLLGRVRSACKEPAQKAFDVCFVVDATRSWYNGGDEGHQRWHDGLRAVCADYSKVVLLGDSMGAAACMLFAELATAVVAFCPQLHLQSSSIRPCESEQWYQRYHDRVCASLAASAADIHVHTGTWQHDLDQVKGISEEVTLHVHPIDSHRVALALDRQDELLPAVHNIIAEQMGYRTSNVRLVNML